MTYTIGEVENLTGVKAHVLRYWEQVISGFTPQKDLSGKRVYSQHEVELIFRIKYLVNQKKYTVQGAGEQILEESKVVQNNTQVMQQIHEIRRELSEIFTLLQKNKSN